MRRGSGTAGLLPEIQLRSSRRATTNDFYHSFDFFALAVFQLTALSRADMRARDASQGILGASVGTTFSASMSESVDIEVVDDIIARARDATSFAQVHDAYSSVLQAKWVSIVFPTADTQWHSPICRQDILPIPPQAGHDTSKHLGRAVGCLASTALSRTCEDRCKGTPSDAHPESDARPCALPR